jgi:hypothetical protein
MHVWIVASQVERHQRAQRFPHCTGQLRGFRAAASLCSL